MIHVTIHTSFMKLHQDHRRARSSAGLRTLAATCASACLLLAACGGWRSPAADERTGTNKQLRTLWVHDVARWDTPGSGASNDDSGPGPAALAEHEPPRVTCAQQIPIYRDGSRQGEVCPAQASRQGLTVVDLSDNWAPFIFSESPELGEAGQQPYRQRYVALSNEQGIVSRNPLKGERYLELYGIFPSFRVVRQRLSEGQRHQCHDAVDDSALEELDTPIRPTPHQPAAMRRAVARSRRLQRRVAELREIRERQEEQGEESDAGLTLEPRQQRLLDRYEAGRLYLESVQAMQAHLQCDGFLGGRLRAGIFDINTLAALRRWQKRHMIVSRGRLDDDSRRVLLLDSRRADFNAALRSLRERVVDAAGLIEDGTASQQWGQVLGDHLDGDAFRDSAGWAPSAQGAPDLVAAATEAAAQALGWTDAEAMERFFVDLERAGPERRVALPLPPRPAYHGAHIGLRAEINRGDVYYEWNARRRRVAHRPTLTLYAIAPTGEIPLIRWGTTIGGWQQENTADGGIGQRYKNSPTGTRLWREIFASPTWLPPESTPDEELLVERNGQWEPNVDLFGPSYRSAYGLVLIMHHKPRAPGPQGEPRYEDEGIRSHGSVSYHSILGGFSHGCHRLFNHLAVRLAGFLLQHRRHQTLGAQEVEYERELEWQGETIEMELTSRGYLYELTPPVPIEVLEGNILGRQQEPIEEFQMVRYPDGGVDGGGVDGGPPSR
jgi:hypothetical protein